MIYSIACWRSENFIYMFSLTDIDKRKKQFKNLKTIIQGFEFLLAILRTRSKYFNLLNPNTDITKKYINFIDSFTKYCIVNNLRIETRIKLELDKPEIFKITPDLLYALRVYLSGDSGAANSIQVLEVSDDQKNSDYKSCSSR